MRMTKSWKLTLITIITALIMPLANDPLSSHGIHISETELQHLLMLALGVSATGGALSANKAIQARKAAPVSVSTSANTVSSNIDAPTVSVPVPKHETGGVKWTGSGWYQTNFVSDPEKGNVLPQGQAYLWVKVPKARSYVTVQLKTENGHVIQIDQSSDTDEDKDITTTRLEMFGRNGQPLPLGVYVLQVQADAGTGDSQGIREDRFEIV